MRHGFSLMMTQIEQCNTSQGDKMKTVCVDIVSSLQRCEWLRWLPCVTALAEAFCILRGVLTKIRMCLQLDDTSIGFKLFNLILEEKSSLLCLCCVSSQLILALWNALKPFSANGPNPWLHIGGLFREGTLKNAPWTRLIPIFQASAFPCKWAFSE